MAIMGRQPTPIDITMIVFGVIMAILTISLFGVAGAMVNISESQNHHLSQYVNYLQLGVAAWYLVTSVSAIASGVTGHRCPYISVIVLSIFAVFVAIAGAVLAILSVFTKIFDEGTDITLESLSDRLVTSSPYKQVTIDEKFASDVNDAFAGLPEGAMIINLISFVFMIVISCVSCCGTCCNSSAQIPSNMPMQSTMIVTTSGGGYMPAAPPSYVSYPPGQTHVFTGTANPNYPGPDNDVAMNSYKA